jgi:predicted unusual protein kinase regulating ubiquinone biosynthesis (AarF/ABC1/UbiB family)
MFELRLVQTDPNFANYQYDPDTGQVVLLDFGASRRFKAAFTRAYQALLRAIINNDRDAITVAAGQAGYQMGPVGSRYHEVLLNLAQAILGPVLADEAYDFGASTIPKEAARMGEEMREFREFWEAPPVDAAYIHRKIAGLFMLAARLKARVNVRELLLPWIEE